MFLVLVFNFAGYFITWICAVWAEDKYPGTNYALIGGLIIIGGVLVTTVVIAFLYA